MEIKFSSGNILLGLAVVFILIGLIVITARKKEEPKVYDTISLIKIITESKTETENKSKPKPKGKIIPPASSYEIENIRKKLNLPEEEEKDTRQTHEEVLKKDPQAKFIF